MDFLNAPNLGFRQPKSLEDAVYDYAIAKSDAEKALSAMISNWASVKKAKTKVDVGAIVRDYRAGMSSREIGENYGIHFTWVMRLMPEGVVRHKAGRRKNEKD